MPRARRISTATSAPVEPVLADVAVEALDPSPSVQAAVETSAAAPLIGAVDVSAEVAWSQGGEPPVSDEDGPSPDGEPDADPDSDQDPDEGDAQSPPDVPEGHVEVEHDDPSASFSINGEGFSRNPEGRLFVPVHIVGLIGPHGFRVA